MPCCSRDPGRSRRARCSSPRACPTDGSPADGLDELTGRGVYYGASASESSQCEGDVVYVVGAANSAGQAVLQLARYAQRVVMVVRGGNLEDGMSRYLVDRIRAAPNVEVRLRSEVVAGRGEGHLEAITLCDRDTGVHCPRRCRPAGSSCSSGRHPARTGSATPCSRDEHGFVVTGPELVSTSTLAWPLASRTPLALERAFRASSRPVTCGSTR